jgi:hypothetical protein
VRVPSRQKNSVAKSDPHRALHALSGMGRFPTDDAIRNLFGAFGMGQVQRWYEPLSEWQMQRLPPCSEGYTLDLDSTALERYGRQEGSLKGHNPRKHGRPSHHPLLAVLNEAHFSSMAGSAAATAEPAVG